MPSQSMFIVPLCELVDGQQADVFVLMTSKEQLTTRDGRPYFRVGFRDAGREVKFPIWAESPLAVDCRDAWQPGKFYKVRGTYRETEYGPQLDIERIREVRESDRADGFNELMCQPASRFDPAEVFDDLVSIVRGEIASEPLRELVIGILQDNRDTLTH